MTWGDHTEVQSGSGSTFILGEPSVVYDPYLDAWVVANDSVTNTGAGLIFPIVVSTSGGPSGFWNDPVSTFRDIPPEPIAHGPLLAVDRSRGPNAGTIYVAFTHSRETGMSEVMLRPV